MSMAENIKQNIKKRKEGFSSEAELRELINVASSKALKQFIQRLDTGEIPIDNISDFIRVIGAYKEINGISDVMEGQQGQGQLPELNMKTDKVIEDHIQEGKLKKTEDERIDVMDMSSEDMAELIRQLDIAQNKENEGAY